MNTNTNTNMNMNMNTNLNNEYKLVQVLYFIRNFSAPDFFFLLAA